MDCKKKPNDAHYYEYEDENNSDVESRLYAEVYYSNTILGDETANATNNVPENSSNLSLNPFFNKSQGLESNVTSVNEKAINYSDRSVANVVSNDASVSNEPLLHTNKDQSSLKTSNQTPNSMKRNLMNNSTKLNNTSKRQKKNVEIVQQQKKNQVKSLRSRKKNTSSNINETVKPQQAGLLSLETVKLLFSNQKRQLRKIKKNLFENNTSKILEHTQHVQNIVPATVIDNEAVQNSVNNEKDSNTEKGRTSDVSVIIDISSESSKDSVDDNSKYNTIVATDAKLSNKDEDKNKDLNDSLSDSEESIYEVPVPPKPIPPLIEVNDSDREGNEEESDSSSSSSSCNSTLVQNQINKTLNKTINSVDEIVDIDSDSNEPSDVILNCTDIPMVASSIEEIKEMNCQPNNVIESEKIPNTAVQNISSVKENVCNINKSNIERSENQKTKINKPANKTLSNKTKPNNKRNIPIEEYFFQPMNNKMKSFYNESWGGENFSINELKNNMSSDPNKWAILDTDLLYKINSKRKRYFGVVCARCEKNGHKSSECSEKLKNICCHMCGLADHYEHACPYKQCLTCGRRQQMYKKTCYQCSKMVCIRCNSRGHVDSACPDLWRRFHDTTNNNSQLSNTVRNVMKPEREMFCCNCAKKGHDYVNCTKVRWSQHFPVPAFVSDYNGPTYSEDHCNSSNVYNTKDSSYNLNTSYHNSCNYNDTFDLNTSLDESVHLSRILLNDSYIRENFLSCNAVTPDKRIIFQINARPSSVIGKVKNFKLIFNIDRNLGFIENSWIHMEIFLKELTLQIQSNFSLELHKNKLRMYVTCAKKYHAILNSLIQQYGIRNNFERSRMFLNPQLNINMALDMMSKKMAIIHKIEGDPFELYDNINRLSLELVDEENESKTDLRFSNKANKLALLQQQLLSILYKNGHADDSLKMLQSLCKKLKYKIEALQQQTKSKKKKLKVISSEKNQISLKQILEYIYHYNNVFAPHMGVRLPSFLQKYKAYIEKCNKLKKDPLLFPQQNIMVTEKKHNKTVTQNSTVNISVSSENCLIPSTSISQASSDLTSNATSLTINTSITNNIHYLQNLQCNDEIIPQNESSISNQIGYKKKQMVNTKDVFFNKTDFDIRKIRLDTRVKSSKTSIIDLIQQACELNSSRLMKHVNIFKNKINNNMFLYENDIKVLRRLIQKKKKYLKKLQNNKK